MVEAYGIHGLLNMFSFDYKFRFDRDLSIAGRVIVENNGVFESKLVRIDRPLLKIPSLAIHLNRSVNDDGFKPNKETNTVPILATVEKALLTSSSSKSSGNEKHGSLFMDLIAKELAVSTSQIRDFELFLFDTQPACVGGALDEFIFSARLDNQLMSYISLMSLIGSVDDSKLENEENIRMVGLCINLASLFFLSLVDHEECGSSSQQGAASNMLFSGIIIIVYPLENVSLISYF